MIPILYGARETNFKTNGIGLLRDTISCEVTEERNGAYECELTYPTDGKYFAEIKPDSIIKVKPNDTSQAQLFRVYKPSVIANGRALFSLEHISYLQNSLPVAEFKAAGSAGAVLQKLFESSILPHKFTVLSDISTVNEMSFNEPTTLRQCLGGKDGSVLDIWGGEYEFDNFEVKLHKARGADRGTVIEYGKNLTDLKQEQNISELYTALYPYAKYKPEKPEGSDVEPDEVKIELAEKIIVLDTAKNYANVKPLIREFSQDFKQGEPINADTLRAKAEQYIKSSDMGTPKINIEVSFVNLAQTAEYEHISALEHVSLCDTVTIRFSKLCVNVKAKVIRTVYDCLREKYITIELGDAKSSFTDTLHDITNEITHVITQVKNSSTKLTEQFEKAVLDATNAITGNSGGHIVFRPAKNPQEILIMDTADTRTAVNVWRWNLSGMGHSSSGVNGKYHLAFLANGQINTEVVFAKKLSGIFIEAGTIEASALSVDYRNSVTNAITDGIKTFETITLEQIFTATDGTFRSEIKKEVTPAINAARDAKSAADAAQSSADTGLQNISDIISDSKLTPNEKTLASKEWATITAEHGDLQKQQKAFNISCNYELTYTELETYLTPLWANMSGTSEIVAATYKQKFVDYYTARQNLLNKIAEITKSTADTANNTANTAAENYTNISQNAEIIKLMSGEKLGKDELRTETSLIINPTAVQIAWNNIAQNIKFEGNWLNGGQMNIYDSVTSQKLITFDPRGMSFFRDNDFLGLIGSSVVRLQDNSVRKGLDIDLDSDGAYIAFAARDSANTSTFTIKWAYAHQDIGNLSAGKLHAGCDIDMHGHRLLNPTFEGGGISGTTNFIKIVDMDEQGNITSYSPGCSMQFVNGILVSATF